MENQKKKKKVQKMIIDLLEKLGNMKLAGNDKGQTIRNEGFKVDIIHEDLHQRYEICKKAEMFLIRM